MNEQRLAKWISRLPRAQISKLHLFYISVQGEEPLMSWILKEISPEVMRSEKDMAAEILEVAQDDCNGREYASRYFLKAYNLEDEPTHQFVLKQKPKGSADPDYGDPSRDGIIGQVLRHKEALMRMVIGSMSTVLDAQQQIIAIQGKHISDLNQRDQARREAGDDDPESIAKAESWIKLTEALATEVVPRLGRFIDGMPVPPAGQRPPGPS